MSLLSDAIRLFWYALRGGQEDAMRGLRARDERLMRLKALGADIDARIHDATILEAAGVPSQDVTVIAKIWASGALHVDSLMQLNDRGIDVRPVIEWARRAGGQP